MSAQQRLVLVVGDSGLVEGVAVELQSSGAFDVETATGWRQGSDRLAWPDVDAIVCVHTPDSFDAVAFLESIDDTYPTLPTYIVGDVSTSEESVGATSFDTAELPALASTIETRLDDRDDARTMDRFDGTEAAKYLNVAEKDIDQLLAGDIDRERAADLLHKRQLVEALFETIPIHLYVKDRQGRHRYVSEQYFEEETSEFRDKADPEIPYVARNHAWRAYEDDRYVIDEGEAILGKEEYLPSLEKWNNSSKVPWRDADENIVGLLGVTYEVTERKERRQEVERQNERLSEFAHLVSHDLRNPLQVARSALELAQSTDDPDPEYLETIDQALGRMGEIIDDVLQLAKYGKSVIEPAPLDLREVITQAWGITGSVGGTLRVEDDIGQIRGDESHVQQLFENLFTNSVKHANRGGEAVTVTVGPLFEDGEQTGFYVADDGIGISAAQRDAIFASGYSTADDGTGFGLTIVQEIVEGHGWSIDVTESVTGGARFEIHGVECPE